MKKFFTNIITNVKKLFNHHKQTPKPEVVQRLDVGDNVVHITAGNAGKALITIAGKEYKITAMQMDFYYIEETAFPKYGWVEFLWDIDREYFSNAAPRRGIATLYGAEDAHRRWDVEFF